MFKSSFIKIALLLVLCLALGLAITLTTTHASLPVTRQGHIVTSGLSPYGPGIPAIRPHLSGKQAFTTADVQAYIKSHPMGDGHGHSVTAQPGTIQIKFITASAASALLHGESIGRPDNALVCYVEYHGTFIADGPMPPRAAGKMLPSKVAVEIYDAQTGNLLLFSI